MTIVGDDIKNWPVIHHLVHFVGSGVLDALIKFKEIILRVPFFIGDLAFIFLRLLQPSFKSLSLHLNVHFLIVVVVLIRRSRNSSSFSLQILRQLICKRGPFAASLLSHFSRFLDFLLLCGPELKKTFKPFLRVRFKSLLLIDLGIEVWNEKLSNDKVDDVWQELKLGHLVDFLICQSMTRSRLNSKTYELQVFINLRIILLELLGKKVFFLLLPCDTNKSNE